MKLKALLFLAIFGSLSEIQAEVKTLEDCRALALESNKQLMISRQSMKRAGYQKGEAFAAYLPAIDFSGGYTYNQRELSIFDSDQLLPTKSFDPATGSYQFNLVKDPSTGLPVKGPNGEYIPSTVALIPKEAMTYDIHNVFFGAFTLTQPLYMGGKIVALNKIAKSAEELTKSMYESEVENVICAVDAAYWQVVSLNAKHRLAVSFVNLLDSLDHNVHVLYEQGFATKSDVLSVDVKLNSARVDLLKVENGLSLSRMALAQVCGLPVDTVFTLSDENLTDIMPRSEISTEYNMQEIYSRRPDLESLRIGTQIAGHKKQLAMSSMLPNVALVGAWSFSNPNMFDGFKKRFKGAFSVGAMLTIPIWHWGGNYNKYRQAKVDETIMELKLEEARSLVDLQVKQASFKTSEAIKTYNASRSNLEAADENLRCATLSFKEGMATTDNVLAAQTAWLKAHSETIDAMIEVKLCDVYLSKCLGTLY